MVHTAEVEPLLSSNEDDMLTFNNKNDEFTVDESEGYVSILEDAVDIEGYIDESTDVVDDSDTVMESSSSRSIIRPSSTRRLVLLCLSGVVLAVIMPGSHFFLSTFVAGWLWGAFSTFVLMITLLHVFTSPAGSTNLNNRTRPNSAKLDLLHDIDNIDKKTLDADISALLAAESTTGTSSSDFEDLSLMDLIPHLSERDALDSVVLKGFIAITLVTRASTRSNNGLLDANTLNDSERSDGNVTDKGGAIVTQKIDVLKANKAYALAVLTKNGVLLLRECRDRRIAIDLAGCEVLPSPHDISDDAADPLPQSLHWLSRIPMHVRHPTRAVFKGEREFLLYALTCPEKEQWCYALQRAAYLTITLDSWPHDAVRATCHSYLTDRTIVCSENEEGDSEQLLWLNMFLHRAFFSMEQDRKISALLHEKFQSIFVRVPLPTYVRSINVVDFSSGSTLPVGHKIERVRADKRGLHAELRFSYVGSFQLTLESFLKVDVADQPRSSDLSSQLIHRASKSIAERLDSLAVRLTVTITRMAGTLYILIPPPPSERLWYGFKSFPDMDVVVQPAIGQSSITLGPLSEWISERVKVELMEAAVLPEMDDIHCPFLHYRGSGVHERFKRWAKSPGDGASVPLSAEVSESPVRSVTSEVVGAAITRYRHRVETEIEETKKNASQFFSFIKPSLFNVAELVTSRSRNTKNASPSTYSRNAGNIAKPTKTVKPERPPLPKTLSK